MSKKQNKMARKSLSELKVGRDFVDVLDSVRLHVNTETIAAAKVLQPEDTGKVFFINQASAYAITLPDASKAGAGWNAQFILATVDSNAVTIEATAADGDNIHGHSIDGEDGAAQTVTEGTGVDVITFISGATKGDRVSLICDGTSYYVFGLAADKAHITLT